MVYARSFTRLTNHEKQDRGYGSWDKNHGVKG